MGVALAYGTHMSGITVSGVSCFVFCEERPRGLAAVSVW